MKYLRSRYYQAFEIISQYNYPDPFHVHAKTYFKANNKIGSKDRKAILEVCYTYYRTGNLFVNLDFSSALLLSITFLEIENVNDWNCLAAEQGLNWQLLDNYWEDRQMFWNWLAMCTELNEKQEFYKKAHLIAEYQSLNTTSCIGFRPNVWAKNHKLTNRVGDLPIGCIEIKNDELPNEFTQIQDLSSQKICELVVINEDDKVWDVCSGAGGKSLNLLSQEKGAFYLSDVRAQILINAKQRINAFGYTASFAEVNLEEKVNALKFNDLEIKEQCFDVILADVPCSGSGTWFRTPEHFSQFDYTELEKYAERQKKIASNAFPFLKSGGLFYYITCSVFKEENSEVKSFILNTLDCELEQEVIYNGLNDLADSMYMCCFRKS